MRFLPKCRYGVAACFTFSCGAALSGAALLTTAGCGGNNNVNSPRNIPTTRPKVTISWPARSRDVAAPTSALSAQLTLAQGDPLSGNPLTFAAFNRDLTRTEAYTETYTASLVNTSPTETTTSEARTGTMTVNVRFFANPNGNRNDVPATTTTPAVLNPVVGDATLQSVTILVDGTGIPNLTTIPRISRVVVNPGQTAAAGETKTLTFTAYDTSNTVIAVTPGSAFFALAPGSSGATLAPDGTVSGVTGPGAISVSATVDGVTSAAASVSLLASSPN